MPWRETKDPYRILVSEIMLQQTQVTRVLVKYQQFIDRFPTLESVAKASLREILWMWQGLGYNRRALALHTLANEIMRRYGGQIPADREILVSLPGIGEATAGAICVFAYNKPEVFIETNIRTVYIQYFFKNKTAISDKQLLPLIEKTLDTKNPRTWYYALMDYGVFLKEQQPNPSRQSRHYQKQSCFAGSNRELRGKILKLLLRHKQLAPKRIKELMPVEPAIIKVNLSVMCKEGLIREKAGKYSI